MAYELEQEGAISARFTKQPIATRQPFSNEFEISGTVTLSIPIPIYSATDRLGLLDAAKRAAEVMYEFFPKGAVTKVTPLTKSEYERSLSKEIKNLYTDRKLFENINYERLLEMPKATRKLDFEAEVTTKKDAAGIVRVSYPVMPVARPHFSIEPYYHPDIGTSKTKTIESKVFLLK